MKIRKLSAALLSAAVCAALLTGCGEHRETSLSDNPGESTVSSVLSETHENDGASAPSDTSSEKASDSSSPASTPDSSSPVSSDSRNSSESSGSVESDADTSGAGTSSTAAPAESTASTSAEQSSSAPQSVPQPTEEGSEPEHQHQYSLISSADASCTGVGYEVYQCSCGDRYTETTSEALGHNYSKVTTSPTCVNSGYTTYTCTRCGQSHKDDYTSALEHKYKSETVKATCTQNGYTLNTCTRCGKEYTSDTTSALGHKWGDWTVTKNATASSEGEKRSECSRCGEYKTESLPKLNAYNSEFESEVIRLVNIEREKYGLSPLSARSDLTDYAELRSEEIVSNFAHARPDGSSPLKYVMNLSGVYAAGENIAYGQRTPEAVMNAWMNSDGHRSNILSSNYKSIGVGCYVYNGTLYWTQIFAG